MWCDHDGVLPADLEPEVLKKCVRARGVRKALPEGGESDHPLLPGGAMETQHIRTADAQLEVGKGLVAGSLGEKADT